MTLRQLAALLGLLLASPAFASAQEASPAPGVEVAPVAAEESLWSGGLDTYFYVPPEDIVAMPIARANRGPLHLEGRFQYEDVRTGSAWLGWTFELGETVQFAATPMVGGVFGRTNGVAPGVEMSLSWKSLELSSESEYLFDLENGGDSYFYNWSELGWQALEWLRCGLALQRLRAYQTDLALETGSFVALSKGPVELMAYGFNLWDSDGRYAILGLGLSF